MADDILIPFNFNEEAQPDDDAFERRVFNSRNQKKNTSWIRFYLNKEIRADNPLAARFYKYFPEWFEGRATFKAIELIAMRMIWEAIAGKRGMAAAIDLIDRLEGKAVTRIETEITMGYSEEEVEYMKEQLSLIKNRKEQIRMQMDRIMQLPESTETIELENGSSNGK